MEQVALYLQDAHDLRDGLEYVQYAEEKGFDAVWQAESRLVRDAIVPMAAYAAVTNKIKVGSGVINNWTRNIALLAATFLTLAMLFPQRKPALLSRKRWLLLPYACSLALALVSRYFGTWVGFLPPWLLTVIYLYLIRIRPVRY